MNLKNLLFLVFLILSCFKSNYKIDAIEIINIKATITKTYAKIEWETSYPAKCTIFINNIYIDTIGLNHSIELNNLNSGTEYNYIIKAVEVEPLSKIYKKNGYYHGAFKTIDKDNVVISNISIEQLWSTHKLTISWETDIESISTITFRDISIPGETTNNKNFTITTEELSPNEEYFFELIATPLDEINYAVITHSFDYFVTKYIPIEMEWINQANQFGTDIIYDIIYANNQFVTIGGNGKLQTSLDGSSWTLQNSNFGTYFIYGICYGNNKYVIVGNSGSTATSSDGISWTYEQTNSFNYSNIYSVAYGNNIYVAAGDQGKIATSNDGIIWSQQNSNFGTDPIMRMSFINNIFFATGFSGKIATSSDGITWTLINSNFISEDVVYGCNYSNYIYYCYGSNGKIGTSTDLITWQQPESSFETTNIKKIIYVDNIYVAVGYSGKIAVSPDLIHFNQVTNNFESYNIRSIVYGNNKFIAVGDNGKMGIGTNVTKTD